MPSDGKLRRHTYEAEIVGLTLIAAGVFVKAAGEADIFSCC